jgi:hypothetical protein
MIEKNKLAELIDGYAIAKSSGNASLLELSLSSLKSAIDSIYSDDFSEPALEETSELEPVESEVSGE